MCKLVYFILICITIAANAELVHSQNTTLALGMKIAPGFAEKRKTGHNHTSANISKLRHSFQNKFDASNSETKKSVSKLFRKYDDVHFLSVSNLEKLFNKITVSDYHEENDFNAHVVDKEKVETDRANSDFKELNVNLLSMILSANQTQLFVNNENQRDKNKTSSDYFEHCLASKELLHIFQIPLHKNLGPKEFLHMCPVLIDQLDSGHCKTDSPFSPVHDIIEESDHTHTTQHHGNSTVDSLVILPSAKAFTAIICINACSIIGVLFIPKTKRVIYNHILQFLVALAVGCMSGNAMLHLLPHALLSESHHVNHHHYHDTAEHLHSDHVAHNNTNMVAGRKTPAQIAALYKGLVALMGMYGFFFLERFFTHFTSHRSKQKKKKRNKSKIVFSDEDKKSSMVHSFLESDKAVSSCDSVVMVVHPNKALKAYADVTHEALLHSCDESLIVSPSAHEVGAVALGVNSVKSSAASSVSATLISHPMNSQKSKCLEAGSLKYGAEPMSSGHGDSNNVSGTEDVRAEEPGHCHSHMNGVHKNNLNFVVLMVLVGDIIHSFCAGLGIGAAFAGSTLGGISTSVAVLSYELPHEIGDMAVLLRSGLTMKRAIHYNILSSLPSFFGAIIGLQFGNIGSSSVWIFAGVGGMFLYLTLVDLIPEMTSVYTKSGEPWFLHLLLQAIGISVGATIMLILSVSEEYVLTESFAL